jgi:hypothetical protein
MENISSFDKFLRDARKYKSKTITVTQSKNDFPKIDLSRKRIQKYSFAFREWAYKLNKNDKLPRGRYFAGKKPGQPVSWPLDDYFSKHDKIADTLISNSTLKINFKN